MRSVVPILPWAIVAAAPQPVRVGVVALEGRGTAAARQGAADVAAALSVAGFEVVSDAWRQARRALPFRVTEADRAAYEAVYRRLDEAAQRLRRGEVAQARTILAGIHEQLDRRPSLPDAAVLRVEALWLEAFAAELAGQAEVRDALLEAAAALAPRNRPSARRFPPPFVARAQAVGAGRDLAPPAWAIDLEAAVEIDGTFGRRPIAPGVHHVIVRWPGAPAVAAWIDRDAPYEPVRPKDALGDAPAFVPQDLRIVCEVTAVASVYGVRVEGRLTGVEVFDCAAGRFRRPFVGPRETLPRTVVRLASAPLLGARSKIAGAPKLASLVPPAPVVRSQAPPADRPLRPGPARWKVAIAVVGAVVAVGLVVGLAVGLTRAPARRIVVEGDGFRTGTVRPLPRAGAW